MLQERLWLELNSQGLEAMSDRVLLEWQGPLPESFSMLLEGWLLLEALSFHGFGIVCSTSPSASNLALMFRERERPLPPLSSFLLEYVYNL